MTATWEKPQPVPLLRSLHVEVTNRCDAKCDFCPRTGAKSRTNDLPVDVVSALLQDLAAMPLLADPVMFDGLGEPLMHPAFKEVFEAAADSGLRWALRTNCSYLDAGAISAIVRYRPSKLILEIDACTQGVLDIVRPGLDAKSIWVNVEHMTRAFRTIPWGCEVVIEVRNMPANAHELQQIVAKAIGLLDGIRPSTVHVVRSGWAPRANMGRHVFPSSVFSTASWPRCSCTSVLVDVFSVSPRNRLCAGEPCGIPWRYLRVQSDCSLSVCPFDADGVMVIGNLLMSSIKEAFFCDAANEIRESLWALKFGDLSLCKECL